MRVSSLNTSVLRQRDMLPPPLPRSHGADHSLSRSIDTSYFVLTADLWSADGNREVNLVRHSATSPSISTATPSAFPAGPATAAPASFPGFQQPGYNPAYSNAYGATPTYGQPGSQYGSPSGSPYYPLTGQPYYPPGSNSATATPYVPPSATVMHTRNLIGSLVASAFLLTDVEGRLGIWFVLQDLSVRTEGNFRLKLNFINIGIDEPATESGGDDTPPPPQLNQGTAPILATIFTEPFSVYSAKKFPGVIESTPLSKCFALQGIKIPIRKDSVHADADLEALHKLGDLDTAIDRVQHRLPVELFSVVDKTSTEVTMRHPMYTPPTAARHGQLQAQALSQSSQQSQSQSQQQQQQQRSAAAASAGLDIARAPVLSEFMWDLYSKFLAIAEGHRVCHDIVVGIKERSEDHQSAPATAQTEATTAGAGSGSGNSGGFKELWKLYQSEIRSLLHDYLATDGDVSFLGSLRRQHTGYSANSVHRDRHKKMFRMADVSGTSAGVKAAQHDLDDILQTSVPGLVSKSHMHSSTHAGSAATIADAARSSRSRSRQENSGTGHRLLTEPSVFNISIVLPPSLAFIRRLRDIVPMNTDIALSTLTSFLDDFLINVFQPQLEEAVADLFAMNLVAPDAFLQDPQWALHAPRPVFKGTVGFANLVRLFSRMLDTVPHDHVFTQVIINQIVAYYDKTFQ
ncbi:Exocyst complex component 4, partial [Ascosphaera acerosa]